ncbi:MAG: RidA family protein [Ignavibacteria bacterium]|nr:RidA family protein [Ignavibacteria bacterium]
MRNKIQKFSSGAKWESIVCYSRVIKAGSRVIVTGTTATDENSEVVGKGNAYEQTRFIFKKIEKYLKTAGAELENVIINRIYITDISKWQEVAKAHAEIFSEIKPCTTMVEVKGLVHPDMIVEIETEAFV